MSQLRDIASKIRSKNAGPFWLTVDIFCGDGARFQQISTGLTTQAVAERFQVAPGELKRFDIDALNVVKFSLPRPNIQGTRTDRDMHGASFANLLADLEV